MTDATACEISSADIGYIASEPGIMVTKITKYVAKINSRKIPLLSGSAVAEAEPISEQCCVSLKDTATNQKAHEKPDFNADVRSPTKFKNKVFSLLQRKNDIIPVTDHNLTCTDTVKMKIVSISTNKV